MKKEIDNNELGCGFIEQAAVDCGVKRGVYYNAKKRLAEGKPLTAIQIKVMKRYRELTNEAKADLAFIKQ